MGRIVVVGSLNVDLVANVPKLPGAGETVTAIGFQIHAGGKGANQAVAASRLGGEVAMIGTVGGDAYSETLLRSLAENRVDTREIRRAQNLSTGLALILVDTTGENVIAVVPGANSELDAGDAAIALNRISDANVVVMQLEVPLAVVERVCLEASKSNQKVIVNAAPFVAQAADLLRYVDVLVVNEVEASALFATDVRDHETARLALKVAGTLGPRVTVITLGAQGVAYCESGSEPESIPGIPVQVVDTTGAGDAFVGALAYALSRDWQTRDAISLGVAAGAATVMRRGAQSSLPAMHDVKRLMVQVAQPDRVV